MSSVFQSEFVPEKIQPPAIRATPCAYNGDSRCWPVRTTGPDVAIVVVVPALVVGAGVSDDTVLARLYGWHRAMRIFDGPDEVHMRTVARTELGREQSTFASAVTSHD